MLQTSALFRLDANGHVSTARVAPPIMSEGPSDLLVVLSQRPIRDQKSKVNKALNLSSIHSTCTSYTASKDWELAFHKSAICLFTRNQTSTLQDCSDGKHRLPIDSCNTMLSFHYRLLTIYTGIYQLQRSIRSLRQARQRPCCP